MAVISIIKGSVALPRDDRRMHCCCIKAVLLEGSDTYMVGGDNIQQHLGAVHVEGDVTPSAELSVTTSFMKTSGPVILMDDRGSATG